jgi:spermidine/putrescine ABC transporter ATP-binding subunit
MASVQLAEVTKRFGSVAAVRRLTLEVRDGELLTLLGPSGCGKTTTLRLVAGFLAPEEGRIRFGGRDVTTLPPEHRNVGIVFQNYALFPHMTVFENIAFGLRMRGVKRAEIERRVGEAVALVRLEGRESAWPTQLSGGMQQRVALARALVFQPRVLLLDEPLAALDKKLREEMRAEIREIQRAVGITTVFVTHDQQEALGLSDRIAVMGRGQIEQVGTPREIYGRPATRFVAEFIGASNVLPVRVLVRGAQEAEVEAEGVGRLSVRLPGVGPALDPGGRAELLIRPERVVLVPAADDGPNTVAGRVARLTYLGSQTEVVVQIRGGRRIVAAVDEHRCPVPLAEGVEVRVLLPPDAFLVL